MRILIACEFSGVVREAFAARGHHAVSCDFLESELPPANGSEHHQGCVSEVLREHWDLMVAFPPCTHLAVSGARWWASKGSAQADAVEFVRMLAAQNIKRIAIENPIGTVVMISTNERSIAVAFDEKPPFATIHGDGGFLMHPEFGIMFLATREVVGPWVEIFGGGHYEIEPYPSRAEVKAIVEGWVK